MVEVRTRIAPSPTGFPHIGTIYQAIFDFVFARKYNGQFIVRVEDTDRARLVEGAEEVIFKSLEWFGLTSDEDPIKGGPYAPYRQSERLEIYKKYALKLIEKNHAYYCFCTKERLDEVRAKEERERKPLMYDKHCLKLSSEEVQKKLAENLPYVIRMKIPENEKIKVVDALAGEIEFDSNLIDDQVIIKSDGFPTYHLAVVIDDYLMKITHIFRGKEWLPSTPKHVLLYRFFGWDKEIPKFIHIPVILNTEGGGKLSKRHGHASVEYYINEGYLPEAILNYLTNIVWNHPEGKEIYPLKEFEKAFDINLPKIVNITSQGPKFDLQKLDWVNGEYIRAMNNEKLIKRLEGFLPEPPSKEFLEKIVPLIKERIKKLSDFLPLTNFLLEEPNYDKEVFNKIKIEDKKQVLEKIYQKLEEFKKPWNNQQFEETFRKLAEELKIPAKEMFQLIRIAVSGSLITPPLFESIQILGERKALERFKKLISGRILT